MHGLFFQSLSTFLTSGSLTDAHTCKTGSSSHGLKNIVVPQIPSKTTRTLPVGLDGGIGRYRVAFDQFNSQCDRLRDRAGIMEAFDQRVHGSRSHRLLLDPHGGQGRRQILGHVIIKTNDRDILWDAEAFLTERL